jgi:hypothetical protein
MRPAGETARSMLLICSPCRATDRRSFSSSSADHRSLNSGIAWSRIFERFIPPKPLKTRDWSRLRVHRTLVGRRV